MVSGDTYYRRDLALVHHRGFGFHADRCAPGVLARLEPVRQAGGLVVELGCGSGLLTRALVEAGHRVVATDASPDMLELAREVAPAAEDLRLLHLPDDPIPPCDAIVSVGHVLSYLPDAAAIDRALASAAAALRPGGILAIDLCDLGWGVAYTDRLGEAGQGRVGDDWAIVSRFSLPAPDRFVRDITTFVRSPDGTWRRDDERHENTLVDTALVPDRLAALGLSAELAPSFGSETLPDGLVVVLAQKPA
jgi:SAM-dependent methyltransferase